MPRRVLTAVPLVFVWLVSAAAQAVGGDVSYGIENSAGHYTGASADWGDDVSVTENHTGCQTAFTGNYVSQLISLNDGSDGLQAGTSHQCENTKVFHYWTATDGGVTFVLTTGSDLASLSGHTFRITRGDDSVWAYKVDGVTKETVVWDRSFASVQTGLLSFAPSGHVAPGNHHDLQTQRYGNAQWLDWAGQDARAVDDPPMCGTWSTSTSWRTGQATSC